MLMAVFAPLAMNAQETLTVYDGTTTNSYVPAYMGYFDDFTKSQFVIPADGLEEMNGGTITSMKFYTTSQNVPYTSVSTVDVYLMEVDYTTISAFEPKANGTIVFQGTLNIVTEDSGGLLTIEFSNPYTYNGGNLLVGIENTTDAGYKFIYFYGQTVTGASGAGYNASSLDNITFTQRNFIPKTTFEYEAAGTVTCARPKNVAVEYTGGTTATVTWTGEAASYNIDVNGTVTNNVTSPYTLTGLSLATNYSVMLQGNCGGGDLSAWTTPVNFTTDLCLPEDMCEIRYELTDSYGDGWNGNAINVVDVATGNVLASWTISSGASATGTLAVCDGRDIQFVWVAGSYPTETSYVVYDVNDEEIFSGTSTLATVDYTVNCTVSSCRKPTDLAASNIGPRSVDLSWTENGEATAWNIDVNGEITRDVTNPYTLTGLTPETTYTVKVTPVCEEEKWSDEITFTTDVACPAPTVTVSDINPTSATVSWDGEARSYTLRYRTARGFIYDFETAEPWAVDNFPPCTTYDGDGQTTYGFNGWTFTNSGYTGACIAFNNDNEGAATMYSHTGNAFGVMFNATSGASNDWFILPEITIDRGYVMTFWVREITDQYGAETINVGICGRTDGTFSAYLAENYSVSTTTWTQLSYDLSDYVGQTIKLAINCVSNDIFGLMIDDIYVGNPSDDTWDNVLTDVTSPYTLDRLTEETTYEVQVQALCGGDDGESEWSTLTNFTTPSNCAVPTALNTSNIMPDAATLSWTGYQETYNLRYRTTGSSQPAEGSFIEGFENGIDNWTVIRNGDGTENTDWRQYYPALFTNGGPACHGGEYAVMSRSYSGSAYSVDNWLISPQVTLEGELRYWVLDDGTYHEHYDVYVSTTGTEISNFTLLYEPGDASSTWTEHVVDLSSYRGQQGYIAFRNIDEDQDFLLIDDVLVGTLITIDPGSWVEVTDITSPYVLEKLESNTEYEWQVQGINRSCDDGVTGWSASAFFTTNDGIIFITDGNWNEAANWFTGEVPAAGSDVTIAANAIIPANYIAEAGTVTINEEGSLTIKDGGQLIHTNTGVIATMEKEITGYTGEKDNYYLLASPIVAEEGIAPTNVTNMLSNTYDLYQYDALEDLEWRNYKAEAFNLYNGVGYLYANSADVTLSFTGELHPFESDYANNYYLLNYEASSADLTGFNLVGNLFATDGYIVLADYESGSGITGLSSDVYFYTMGDGELIAADGAVAPLAGVFVQTSAASQVALCYTEPLRSSKNTLNMNLSSNGKLVDAAYLRFDNGSTLNKLQLHANSTKLYMPVNGSDYAVANADMNLGEMPVNFKANANGAYTLSFSNDNVEFSYLHLIDNLTGNDVDLLANPSYSFEASYTDYASRFKLVYSTSNSTLGNEFGFVSNGNLKIFGLDGQATLKVMDITGRTLSTENFSGSYDKQLNLSAGVYMIQLIQGNDVKTQKIVIK